MNFLTTLLTAGVNTATTVANALGDDFLNESISTTAAISGGIFNLEGTLNLLGFFFLNLLFVGIIVLGLNNYIVLIMAGIYGVISAINWGGWL